MHYSVLYGLNTLDACWIAIDVWRVVDADSIGLLILDVMPIYMIITLDIIIIICSSINFWTVICLPTVCYVHERSL
jgi:hypothetical protein